VIAYRATHSTSPGELAQFAAGLLRAGRRRRVIPEGSRALRCFWQAVAGLRWFRDRTTPDALAREAGISRATACRYLDEVVAVLAAQAPDLRAALERAEDEGRAYVPPARQQGLRPSNRSRFPDPAMSSTWPCTSSPCSLDKSGVRWCSCPACGRSPDVREHAGHVLARLRDCSMPCDGAWTTEKNGLPARRAALGNAPEAARR
jgi:hypothetical protein